MRRDIPSAPQLPWLVLPQSPNCKKYMTFASLSDGKDHKLKLPKPVRGAWFCASSKGWLVMVKEDELDSQMFLLNPISRAMHQLPSLKTIPYFRKYVEEFNNFGVRLFCAKVVLSISDIDSESFTVAAMFLGSNVHSRVLGLCRPGDATWSVVQEYEKDLVDIMFSSGMLYALFKAGSSNCNGIATKTRTLNLGDNNNHAVQLTLIYDNKEERKETTRMETTIEVHGDYFILSKGVYNTHLLESTVRNEVLVMYQMLDFFIKRERNNNGNADGGGGGGGGGNQDNDDEGNQGDDGHADEEGNGEDVQEVDNDNFDPDYVRTSGFSVYKLGPKNDNFIRVQSSGDQNVTLFFAEHGSLSINPAGSDFKELEGCIFFATKENTKVLKTNISRDIGVFYLDGGRVERSFPSAYVSVWSRLSWFTPSLW